MEEVLAVLEGLAVHLEKGVTLSLASLALLVVVEVVPQNLSFHFHDNIIYVDLIIKTRMHYNVIKLKFFLYQISC